MSITATINISHCNCFAVNLGKKVNASGNMRKGSFNWKRVSQSPLFSLQNQLIANIATQATPISHHLSLNQRRGFTFHSAFIPNAIIEIDNMAGGKRYPTNIPHMQNIAILDLSKILLFRKLLLFIGRSLPGVCNSITGKNEI